MKSQFRHYYAPTKVEFDSLWKDALIVVDANVLLHLYSYSDATRTELIEILEANKSRLWLPYQAACEFYKNRRSAIRSSAKAYDSFDGELQKLLRELKEDSRHPFADLTVVKDFEACALKLAASLKKSRDAHSMLLDSDTILDRLDVIFEDRVGKQPSDDDLQKLYERGKDRYKRRVPPGFADDDKPEPDRYGDFVIWIEVLEKAKAENKGVMLLIDDEKEDWFEIEGKAKVGPRVELRKEFAEETGQLIHLYTSAQFVKMSAKNGRPVPPEVQKELEDAERLRKTVADSVSELVKSSHSQTKDLQNYLSLPKVSPEQHAAWEKQRDAFFLNQKLPFATNPAAFEKIARIYEQQKELEKIIEQQKRYEKFGKYSFLADMARKVEAGEIELAADDEDDVSEE